MKCVSYIKTYFINSSIMSHPILAKEKEHLELVKNTRENPALVLLTALLYSEENIPTNQHKSGISDYPRIVSFLCNLIDSGWHGGDCTSCAATCSLCVSIDRINDAMEVINKSKEFFPDIEENLLLHKVLSIVIHTQPKKLANDYRELKDKYGLDNYETYCKLFYEIYGFGTEIDKRIEIFNNTINDIELINLNNKIEDLLNFTKQALTWNEDELNKWWREEVYDMRQVQIVA